MAVSCHFRDCEALLTTSLTHVAKAPDFTINCSWYSCCCCNIILYFCIQVKAGVRCSVVVMTTVVTTTTAWWRHCQVRCSGGEDLLSTADICLTALPTLNGTCPAGQSAPASVGCRGDVSCVVSGSTSHCGRCPTGYYGNGSVCERKC